MKTAKQTKNRTSMNSENKMQNRTGCVDILESEIESKWTLDCWDQKEIHAHSRIYYEFVENKTEDDFNGSFSGNPSAQNDPHAILLSAHAVKVCGKLPKPVIPVAQRYMIRHHPHQRMLKLCSIL